MLLSTYHLLLTLGLLLSNALEGHQNDLSAACVSLVQCPAHRDVFTEVSDDFYGTSTDFKRIVYAASQLHERWVSMFTTKTPHDLPPIGTIATTLNGKAVDPILLVLRNPSIRTTESQLRQRPASEYVQIFSGSGTSSEDRDAAVIGAAYLTHTLLNGSTYDVDECLHFCDFTSGCVFVNLYYEYNFPPQHLRLPQDPNRILKCVAYGDVHLSQAKVDFGQLVTTTVDDWIITDETYIQQSTGWARKAYFHPPTPDGYDALPQLDGANDAPGYIDSVFLSHYDVDACAAICNNWPSDEIGGSCKYFNIWRAVIGSFPVAYSCSLEDSLQFYIAADPSTAVYHGQGDLTVTKSWGYKRKTHIFDGGFENYSCPDPTAEFCFTHTTDAWLASSIWEGNYDASIFHYKPYAHTGRSVAVLGSAFGCDEYPGTLTVASSLSTVPGVIYIIEIFHSRFGEDREVDTFVEVFWNADLVGVIYPEHGHWGFDHFEVIGRGNDELDLRGGRAPSYHFIDDIFVMQA
ncbi:hypothetical protein C8R42DRAFT_725386 [Lentinula raphanica]|nr:hypothetical protein C8R42DRAFT_725386 [Lentinula raphanica]